MSKVLPPLVTYSADFRNKKGETVTEKFRAHSEDEAYKKIRAFAKSKRLKIHIWRSLE